MAAYGKVLVEEKGTTVAKLISGDGRGKGNNNLMYHTRSTRERDYYSSHMPRKVIVECGNPIHGEEGCLPMCSSSDHCLS